MITSQLSERELLVTGTRLEPLLDEYECAQVTIRKAGSESSYPCPRRLEVVARALLDSRVGRTLSDGEWSRARAKLLQFVAILRAWDQRTKSHKPGFGNV
ncbi:MAG: hypothetical protein ABJB97_08380 [Acidobacteriota bacterium]